MKHHFPDPTFRHERLDSTLAMRRGPNLTKNDQPPRTLNKHNKPIFPLTFDPRLPPINHATPRKPPNSITLHTHLKALLLHLRTTCRCHLQLAAHMHGLCAPSTAHTTTVLTRRLYQLSIRVYHTPPDANDGARWSSNHTTRESRPQTPSNHNKH